EDALVREGEVRHGEGEMATGQWLLAHYRKRSITRSTRRRVWTAPRMETGAGRPAATAARNAASSSPGGGAGPNARAGAGFARSATSDGDPAPSRQTGPWRVRAGRRRPGPAASRRNRSEGGTGRARAWRAACA